MEKVVCTAEGPCILPGNKRSGFRKRIHHNPFGTEPGKWRRVLNESVNEELEEEIETAKAQFARHLTQLREQGVVLFVDGKRALPGEAADMTVQEDSVYMADYVLGDAGNIEQVRFDKVTCC